MQVRLSKYRSLIQLLFFGIFVFLFSFEFYQWGLPIPSTLFLYSDPLLALVMLITGGTFIAWVLFSLVTVIVTVLFGRVFCGYACPVGMILDWFAGLSGLLKIKPSTFRKLKPLPIAILVLILMLSLFSSSIAMALDPLSLLTRAMTVLLEMGKLVVNSVVEITGPYISEQLGIGGTGFHGIDENQALNSFSYKPTILDSSGWILGLFAFVIGLNFLGKRFWCRYLCPLGGLLGLLGRIPLFRRKVDVALCKQCVKCTSLCSLDAVTGNGQATDSMNCTLCLSCREGCPEKAISWGLKPELTNEVPSRRAAIAVLGGGIVAAAAIPVTGYAKDSGTSPLRPPGVSNEEMFIQKCIRCGQCILKCPTKTLQPSQLQNGIGSLWTPRVDYSKGVCDYYCNMCGASCPTGAIEFLMLEQKQVFVMGIAEIDKKRCIRFKNGFGCGLCARVCPVPNGAISTDITYENFGGATISSGMPLTVLEEKCIGCGVCVAVCPVKGEKAIKVVRRRVGENALRSIDRNKPPLSKFD